MKIASFVLLAGSASAFTTPSLKGVVSKGLKMSDNEVSTTVDVAPSVAEPVAVLPQMSQALPWMERPSALDGTLAGDVGFDPFGFAKTKEDLLNYREAEVKHGRLAMLVSTDLT